MHGILTYNHASNGLPLYQDHLGHNRFLGFKPPDPAKRAKFKAMPSAFALVPRSQWIEIDRRPLWGNARFILDQAQHSSCVGYSAAGSQMRTRDLAGMAYAKLSGSYIYSWVNGGVDQGASISDAMTELLQHGTCLDSTCPVNSIYRRDSQAGDEEAQRFRLADGFTITDGDQASAFDWICSAVQSALIPQFAIRVGNNFGSFDSNGVASFESGQGNHSVLSDGMVQVNGTWYLTVPNSWGPDWGPFGNGYVLLSEQHIMGVVQAMGEDSFIHLDEITDPNDPTNPIPPA